MRILYSSSPSKRTSPSSLAASKDLLSMADGDSHLYHRRSILLLITILISITSYISTPVSAQVTTPVGGSGSPTFSAHDHHEGCVHYHDHGHDHRHESSVGQRRILPEELAEEEDLMLESSLERHHDDDHREHHNLTDRQLSDLGMWVNAMGCSLLVSLASLICLLILPLLFWKGKPSKMVVDSLATFGAGAMLGDAFLHQLPHAFSGGHSHDHAAHDHHEVSHSHSHSLQDLSVGLSVLFGIVLFLLVEKAVRYVEEISSKGGHAWGHGHHHHHHNSHRKLKDGDTNGITDKLLATSEGNLADESDTVKDENFGVLRKRVPLNSSAAGDAKETDSAKGGVSEEKASSSDASSSSLVFGYLNLFSDGVHNFTDGMALGSAFLLYGSVGGWSRTLFLLAHEIPQEVGDFGILVRSGFSASKALFFNFLSALVALVGTALALLLGKDPGQSSLIEGFTAGGFIYIAVAGVLPEMNNNESTTLKSTLIQLSSLLSGIGVALCISLAE